MKWIELIVELAEDSDFNRLLRSLVKPYIADLYTNHVQFSWHFFREPSLCWRFYADDNVIDSICEELSSKLELMEGGEPIITKYYFGAFLEEGKVYNGESDYYGKEAWEASYKLWEAGSNLALVLLDNPTKPISFHAVRSMHLMQNQLGLTRFQEGLLHLNQASGFIKEGGASYFDLFEKLYGVSQEILVRVQP